MCSKFFQNVAPWFDENNTAQLKFQLNGTFSLFESEEAGLSI